MLGKQIVRNAKLGVVGPYPKAPSDEGGLSKAVPNNRF